MCPHRTFHDDTARLWNAWDVVPMWGERRYHERREHLEQRRSAERRRQERRRYRGLRIALPPQLAQGWIAFESGDERRRLAPIPPGWHELTEEQLVELWRVAEPLPPRRKRLIE